MLSSRSKITLGILGFFLLVILFVPFNQNGFVGFLFLILTGLASLSAAGFISNDFKNLNNATRSKILSVVLTSTALFALTWLFYNLGNIGAGDKGIFWAISAFLFLLMWGISIIAGIIRVVRNKINTSEGSPNKILLPVTILLLVASFFTPLIILLANISSNPLICKSIPEFRDSSLMQTSFSVGVQDWCVLKVATSNLKADYCALMKNSVQGYSTADPNFCLFIIARDTQDLNVCNLINNESSKTNCIDHINWVKEQGF